MGPFLKPLTFPLWWFLGWGQGGAGQEGGPSRNENNGQPRLAPYCLNARPADCLFYSLG